MEFWSKGLGKKRVDLYLGKGDATLSGDRLYLQGQMEAPISWDYIMPLDDDDIIDFFALLQEPDLAAYIYHSPNRWRLCGTMATSGLQLALLVGVGWVKSLWGRNDREEPVIQVPPPTERKKRPTRRRLGSKKPAEPTPSETDTALEEPPKTASI